MAEPKFIAAQKLSATKIAKMYRVPYWLLDATLPKPSWLRRPIWRLRALLWR